MNLTDLYGAIEPVFKECATVTVRGIRDFRGREHDDPLWGLPHSKCSCPLCADWRAKHAHKLGTSA